MKASVDVAVVGGGVIGCSVAYHAARRGARVALFEAGQVGSGASGAAAGMLAAQAEAREPGPFLNLLLESREMHRPFGETLYEETGLDPEYVWVGTLRATADETSAEGLHARYLWQRRRGLSARWMDPEEARDLEPALSSSTVAALYLPEDGQVNSPRLVRALSLAARRGSARIEEFTNVRGLMVEGSRVTGVRTSAGETVAGAVVLAGGASSASLVRGLGVEVPVHPVKGEILATIPPSLPIRANVWDERCYMVPKRDGRVVIGATEEPGVRDPRPTLGGVAALSGAAVRLVPGISAATFVSAWGGLRPGTPDNLPVLGAVEDVEGLLLATGHYRNGVLLAPLTGEAISALALGETPVTDISPFSPNRFTRTARA